MSKIGMFSSAPASQTLESTAIGLDARFIGIEISFRVDSERMDMITIFA
jgi:hypothetical protein